MMSNSIWGQLAASGTNILKVLEEQQTCADQLFKTFHTGQDKVQDLENWEAEEAALNLSISEPSDDKFKQDIMRPHEKFQELQRVRPASSAAPPISNCQQKSPSEKRIEWLETCLRSVEQERDEFAKAVAGATGNVDSALRRRIRKLEETHHGHDIELSQEATARKAAQAKAIEEKQRADAFEAKYKKIEASFRMFSGSFEHDEDMSRAK